MVCLDSFVRNGWYLLESQDRCIQCKLLSFTGAPIFVNTTTPIQSLQPLNPPPIHPSSIQQKPIPFTHPSLTHLLPTRQPPPLLFLTNNSNRLSKPPYSYLPHHPINSPDLINRSSHPPTHDAAETPPVAIAGYGVLVSLTRCRETI